MTRRTSQLLATAVCLLAVAELVAILWFDDLQRSAGRPDLGHIAMADWVLVLAVVASATTGVVLAWARPANPVGWLFLLLALTVLTSGVLDEIVQQSRMEDSTPGSTVRAMAVVSNASWMPWFVLIALILFLTPTGTHLSARWRRVAWVQVGAGLIAILCAFPSSEALDPPHEDLRNPMAIEAIQPAADVVGHICVYVMGLGLILSGVSVIARFRRAHSDERRQLLWLLIVVVPLPLFVVLAFVTARNGSDAGTLLATGGFVTLVPVAAGLSVLRFRLYDVERIVASTVTWVLLSVILVATYSLVVWLGARAVPSGTVSPVVAATVGAVAAAAIAFPLRQALQDQVDRRFDRRAYDARHLIAERLAGQHAGIDVEAVLREALHDPGLTVVYADGNGAWINGDGSAAAETGQVEVDRHGRVVARIGFDPLRNTDELVRRSAALAAAELDNTRLRAELARQVEDIAASRARLASAQRRERRKIERDLHDGAQQSLLALAFNLRSAHLDGDPERMGVALHNGADAAQSAVRQLRDLANGLHPAALADGGLAAALDDMSRHSPVPLHVRAEGGRLDPSTEFTAWSVIGEAVVNAQKHAGAHGIFVDVERQSGTLRLQVRDDGHGGANPDGPGLRGLRDRVEAARGRLSVVTGPTGTTVEAVLPCES